MKTNTADLLDGLPGCDLIHEGLTDLRAGRHTIAACMVRIASPRLTRAGLINPEAIATEGVELELYQLLSGEGDRAYSRYNSLLRELVSFEHALDHRISRSRAGDFPEPGAESHEQQPFIPS
jgi:hypothetical protein